MRFPLHCCGPRTGEPSAASERRRAGLLQVLLPASCIIGSWTMSTGIFLRPQDQPGTAGERSANRSGGGVFPQMGTGRSSPSGNRPLTAAESRRQPPRRVARMPRPSRGGLAGGWPMTTVNGKSAIAAPWVSRWPSAVPSETSRCSCSICRRRGSGRPSCPQTPSRFAMAERNALRSYRFGSGSIDHRFCAGMAA